MCSPVTSPSFGPNGPNQMGPNVSHHGPNPSMNSGPFGPNLGNPAQGGVQVQSKGANTLSYMPMGQNQGMPPPHPETGAPDMNAPSSVPTTPGGPNSGPPGGGGGGNNYRFELDFMQAFAEPLTNLESKVPQTKLQYFPNSKAGVSSNSSSTLTQTGPRMSGPMPGGGGPAPGGNPAMGGGPHGPTGGPMMNRPPMNVGPGNGNQMNLQINMQMNQGNGGHSGPNGGPGPAMSTGGPPSGFGNFEMFQQQLYSTNQSGSSNSGGGGGGGNSAMGPSGGGGGPTSIPASSGPGMMPGPS